MMELLTPNFARSIVLPRLITLLLGLVCVPVFAQTPQPTPPPLDPLLQIMVTQPSIDVVSNVQVKAVFDPPTVRPGEKAIYRVTFNALNDSIKWPEEIASPAGLQMQLTARGQTFVAAGNSLQPQTTINFHVRSASPGSFTVPEFALEVYGRRVAVPAATLVVTPQATSGPPRSLELEPDDTSVYVGQPVKVRVLMHSTTANVIQAIQDLHFNGDGFLIDQGTARQTIQMVPTNGGQAPAYQYETTLTPLVSGKLTVSAQGFTAGNRFTGAIVIQGQAVIPGGPPEYILVDSDPVTLTVRPLPRADELPGFTGAIGKLMIDRPMLSTNRIRVGDLLKLFVTVRGEGNLLRLVAPPPPRSTDWQITPATPGGPPAAQLGGAPVIAGSYATFTYTLIPLTTNAAATPAIPFSYFDSDSGRYVDLTIPAVPVEVLPGTVVGDTRALMEPDVAADEQPKLTLSNLAESPGRTVSSLEPLQVRGWFLALQCAPVLGFIALWQWDRRRRFLEQHPDIILRRRARRSLRRERKRLRRAAAAGDPEGFAAAGVNSLRVSVAPHFPAEPQALVSRDVLAVMGDGNGNAAVVQRFFASTDARFSDKPLAWDGLIALEPELNRVLNELEAKL